jgi:hypothetical protein
MVSMPQGSGRRPWKHNQGHFDSPGAASMVVSEGMELVIVLLVILANLIGLVVIQRWSGLT